MKLAHMHQNRQYEKYAWPGGYPMYYIVADAGVLCADCANKEYPRTLDADDRQFFVVGAEVNWEDPELCCDHCSNRIEVAYEPD